MIGQAGTDSPELGTVRLALFPVFMFTPLRTGTRPDTQWPGASSGVQSLGFVATWQHIPVALFSFYQRLCFHSNFIIIIIVVVFFHLELDSLVEYHFMFQRSDNFLVTFVAPLRIHKIQVERSWESGQLGTVWTPFCKSYFNIYGPLKTLIVDGINVSSVILCLATGCALNTAVCINGQEQSKYLPEQQRITPYF